MYLRFFAHLLCKCVTFHVYVLNLSANLAHWVTLQVIRRSLLHNRQILHRYQAIYIQTLLNRLTYLDDCHIRDFLLENSSDIEGVNKLVRILYDYDPRFSQQNPQNGYFFDNSAGRSGVWFQLCLHNIEAIIGKIFVELQSICITTSLILVEIWHFPTSVFLNCPYEEKVIIKNHTKILQPIYIAIFLPSLRTSLILIPPNLMVEDLVLKWAGSENIGRFLVKP